MTTLLQDVRCSIKTLRKKPLYTVVVVLMLAFGVGTMTAVVTILEAVYLCPYGLIDSDRWVYIWEHRDKSDKFSQLSVSIPNYLDWKENTKRIFAEMAIWLPWSYTASGLGSIAPQEVRAVVVSPEVFASVRATPILGRWLTVDDAKSNERRVMLSYGFWKRAYGADPSLPGKTVQLNGASHTVVGIAPPEFAFPPEEQIDVWTVLPASVLASGVRASRGYRVAGWLRPGVTAKMADAALMSVSKRLSERYSVDQGYSAQVVPMREEVAGEFRAPLIAVSGAVGAALILLCLNVGCLQLAFLESRKGEIALRVALGARRVVLVRQLLLETVLLFGVGGALGTLVEPVLVRLLMSGVPPQEISWLRVPTDGRVLASAICITASAGFISGLLLLIKVMRSESELALNIIGSSIAAPRTTGHLSNFVIVAQIAVVFLPLSTAGLLIDSFVKLQQVAPGFEPNHRLTMAISAPKSRYAGPAEIVDLADRIRRQMLTIPGIKRIGLAQAIPFSPGARWLQEIALSDPKGLSISLPLPMVRYCVVTPGYFEAMGIPLKTGRLISDSDSNKAQPVVVISQKLAQLYYRGENPVGRFLWVGSAETLAVSSPRVVIGVVGDTHMYALDNDPDASAWVPMTQQKSSDEIWRRLFLVADTETEDGDIRSAMQQHLRIIDPTLATADVLMMADRLSDSLWRQRISSRILSAFGVAALGIALLGVFGLTSYRLTARVREIGIRIALGATPAKILKMVLGRIVVLTAAGALIGVAGASVLNRLLQGLLFGVQAGDPLISALVSGALVLAALTASFVPATRAASVDPLVSIRTQ